MASSLEAQTSSSHASFSHAPRPGSRLEDSSIELLFTEFDSEQSGCITRRCITGSLLEVYQSLAPTPKPYHLLHPDRADDWHIYVESLFASGTSDDAVYDLPQFKELVHSWKLPSAHAAHAAQAKEQLRHPRKSLKDKLARLLQQLRTRIVTNGHRYIFILVVLSLQISLALWQFFTFFNNPSARAAFVSRGLLREGACR
jgi:hypothetical protein